MKFLSYLMKLLYLMTLLSQQLYLCSTLFNMHDTFMKHTLRLALERKKENPFSFNKVQFFYRSGLV